jgi:hypothetical protein
MRPSIAQYVEEMLLQSGPHGSRRSWSLVIVIVPVTHFHTVTAFEFKI